MSSLSRREFLVMSALASAGVGYTRSAYSLPTNFSKSRRAISNFIPDLIDPERLRHLAQVAIDAAHSAGVQYADVRVSNRRIFSMGLSRQFPVPFSQVNLEYAYGIRVRANGTWGFAFGIDPTDEGVARSARAAAQAAQAVRLNVPSVPMATAPVVHGEWSTPVQIDPFSVPPDAHANVLGAYIDAGRHLFDGDLYGSAKFTWSAETRVFASSEGSLITQHLTQSAPEVIARGGDGDRAAAFISLADFAPVSAGFETVIGGAIQERIKERTEEAVRLARYPNKQAEVGRYNAIIDGVTLGWIFGATLARALEMNRVLGEDADGAGTSFLSPVDDVLGQPLFSPLLNVQASRSLPSYGAMRWDDEGVVTESYPLIHAGRVVDYLTTRSSAPQLASWYARANKPVQSHGTAVAWTPTMTPVAAASQLHIAPGEHAASLDALVAQLDHGLLIRGIGLDGGVQSDPRLLGGMFTPDMVYEVRRGKIVARLLNGAIQFNTKRFWNKITMLGDPSTVQTASYWDFRGHASTKITIPIAAPAAQLADAEMLQVGRHL